MTHHKLPEVEKRLAMIEGHIKGIRKMIADGKSYPEIVHQITAVRASLDGAMGLIIEDLVEGVSQAPHGKRKQATAELKDSLSNIL